MTQPGDPRPIPPLREALTLLLRLVMLVRPYWGALLKSTMLGLALTVFGLATPYLSKLLIDEVYPTRDVRLLHVLVVATLGLSLSLAVSGAIKNYFTSVVGVRLANATLLMFFNHLQYLPLQFFEEHRVGEVMSRFQDVRNSLGAVTRVLGTVLSTILNIILVPPLLLVLDWRLALVSAAAVPFSTAVTLGSTRVLRRHWKRSTEAYAALNALQVEALSHVRTIKTLALEPSVFTRVREEMEEAQRLQLRATGIAQSFSTTNGIIGALRTAVFTWYGWTLILRGQLTLGDFVAFSAYAGYLFQPISQWVSVTSSFQQNAVQLSRMFEYLDIAAERGAHAAYLPPAALGHVLTGQLELRDVSFGYDPGQPVLRDISLTFPAGSVTAVVGPSGAGKSTLLRLLCALDWPQSGTVLADGLPLADLQLSDLRRQVGVIWQDAAVFRGTLWENLTIGVDAPDKQAVDEVVRICRLEQTVANLPAGYDTPVAEWGATLSAGQKQRVALARILLRDPPILLLDEATANVDLATEGEVLSGLVRHTAGRTVVMVTHRLTTAALAQRVCVLDAGRLVAVGTHAELLATCETYQAMHAAMIDPPELRPLRIMAHGG